MGKYSLYIETGNAAFEDAGNGLEVARILEVASANSASADKPLYDINGNNVGKAVYGSLPSKLKADTFSLSFDTSNAAFEGDPATEVARILTEAAKKAADGTLDFKVFDINGNAIGMAKLTTRGPK